MKKRRFNLGLLAILTAILSGNLAAIADFSSVYKVTTDGKTKIYIPGTANSPITYFALGAAKPQVLVLNACGWGKVKNTATAEILDIMSQDQQAQLTINYNPTGAEQPAPTCTSTNGTYTDSNAAQPVGTAFRTGTTIWIKAGTAAGATPIETQARLTKTTKVNACGWATVTPTAANPMESFKIGTTEYMLSDVPTTNAPQICKKSPTGYTSYTPATGF